MHNQGDSSADETSKSSSPSFPPIPPDLSFPWRLFRLLQDVSDTPNGDIIAWTDKGKAFQIKNQKGLEQDLLPTYFNTSKYESFRRQLLNYGFQCVSRKEKICKLHGSLAYGISSHGANIDFCSCWCRLSQGILQRQT